MFKDTHAPSRFEADSIPVYYDWTKMKFLNKTLAKNKSAPEWKLAALAGDTISLKDYRGKYLLLHFLFSKKLIENVEEIIKAKTPGNV
ncbi:hypothetical protein [Saccharicrinis carchari]|uniref:hypothetical protein n=1 Tax=Saccharicrinis carchari TaxID=1168039 RepID=UPI00163DDB32|nr:hypothetical protein [Saccharicrinis carchari]